MDAFTPQQTTELVSRIGCKKAHMRLDKLFVNSLMTGPLLGFGCAIMTSTEAAEWYQINAPGLIRTISASFFPIGLVMIVLSGSDLFTSNVMFMTVAFLNRRITMLDLLKNWVVSYLGNLAGTLFFVSIVTGYGGVFETAAYRTATINYATQKMLTPQWHQIMLRAIGANWLVCFAVFISISSREIASKIIAIWFPTVTFVALGLDHVIANMFFIPNAIWYGHPDIGVGLYIWKSMIPTAIGNIIGGALFVAAAYWYLYMTGEGSVDIDFNLGSLDTAMEVGGPMGSMSRKQGSNHNNGAVIEGKDPASSPQQSIDLPHSGTQMTSALGKELSGEMYGDRKLDPERGQV
ncbi:MAG: hypothetical protein Q9170_002693 [Blastenia crenularia]